MEKEKRQCESCGKITDSGVILVGKESYHFICSECWEGKNERSERNNEV